MLHQNQVQFGGYQHISSLYPYSTGQNIFPYQGYNQILNSNYNQLPNPVNAMPV